MGPGWLCYAGQVPTFEPFAGLRYDLDRLSAGEAHGGVADGTEPLSRVIAPPYDVISPAERDALAARSPYNMARLELPTADATIGLDAYQTAAHLLGAWRSQGILRRDAKPAYYGYAMAFEDEMGRLRHSLGVIGALALSPPGEEDVLPHEQTMSRPKSDRLELLRACRANLSPVWGLSLAPSLSALCQPPVMGELATAVDDDGVTHLLWTISDPRALKALAARVGGSPIVIADGHHRYETALAYQAERRAATDDQAGDHDFIMALVVEMAEEQLSVRAIHRLLSGLPGDLDIVTELGRHFEISQTGAGGAALVAAMADQGALGLATPAGNWLARPRPATDVAAGVDLDSSRLDEALRELAPHDIDYEHRLAEALNAVHSGRAQATVLLRPASVAVIAETARQRRRLPPKTTLFWPKPRTGMVMRLVEDQGRT